MNSFPDEPGPHKPILIWARQVQACLRSLIPQQSPDLIPDRSPGGTVWRVKWPPFNSSAQLIISFQLIDLTKSNGSGGYTQQVRVALGVLQDTSPGGTAWIPTGMTAGDAQANWYITPVSGQGFIWLVVTYDTSSGVVSSVTLNQGASVPAQTSGTAYIALGTYDATASPSSVAVTGAIGDQSCELCGSSGTLVWWPT